MGAKLVWPSSLILHSNNEHKVFKVPLTQALRQIEYLTLSLYCGLRPAAANTFSTCRVNSLPFGEKFCNSTFPVPIKTACPGPDRAAVQSVIPKIK